MFVENAQSLLSIQHVLSLGGSGRGYLTVRNGGRVQLDDVLLHRGRLEVESGGGATLQSGSIGLFADENAEVIVRGAGSYLHITKAVDGLQLGRDGTASLIVQDGGFVTASSIVVRTSSLTSNPAGVRVTGLGSQLTADNLSFSGASTLEVSNGGHLALRALELGNTTPNLTSGSIDIGFLLGAPTPAGIRVGFGGFLSASTYLTNVHNFGGTVQVGSSPGTMTIEGDFIQEAGVLRFSMAGTQPEELYSQLVVNGDLQLAGIIELVFENGFAPLQGQTFDLFDINGTSDLSGMQLQITNLAPGFQYDLSPTPQGYRLTALNDGQYVAPLTGDYNNDDILNLADYVVWRDSLDQIGFNLAADGNRQGTIEERDYLVWSQNFGTEQDGLGSVMTPIPEPGSIAILISLWSIAVLYRNLRPESAARHG